MSDNVLKLKELIYKDDDGASKHCYVLLDGGQSAHYYVWNHCTGGVSVHYDKVQLRAVLNIHGWDCKVVSTQHIEHRPQVYD